MSWWQPVLHNVFAGLAGVALAVFTFLRVRTWVTDRLPIDRSMLVIGMALVGAGAVHEMLLPALGPGVPLIVAGIGTMLAAAFWHMKD